MVPCERCFIDVDLPAARNSYSRKFASYHIALSTKPVTRISIVGSVLCDLRLLLSPRFSFLIFISDNIYYLCVLNFKSYGKRSTL